MTKRFLRLFICLSILLVIAFQQSACTIIDDMFERRNQEIEKSKEFCEQYMQSIPVDEEGYEISYEEGIETCHYTDLEGTVLDDGETVINFEKGFGLYLEYKGEKIRIEFETLVEKSEKFRKVLDVWKVYEGLEIGNYRGISTTDLRACTDGVDIYFIYRRNNNVWSGYNEIPPNLFKYDISEDKILYLGHYPSYEIKKGSGQERVLINK